MNISKCPIVLHIVICNVNVTSEIVVRIFTGLQNPSHFWSWKSSKSIIKDRGVNLYGNETESSINLVAFPTIICFQMYLFIDHFEIKNKLLNKQVLRRASGCSMVLRCDSYFLWFSGISCDPPGVIRCSVSAPSAIGCSATPGPLVSVLLDAV